MAYSILIGLAICAVAASYVVKEHRLSKARNHGIRLNYVGVPLGRKNVPGEAHSRSSYLDRALDEKSFEREAYCKRVTAFSIAIARAMGLSREATRVTAYGAFLHDIGESAIPDAILRKPNELTPDELAVMREHCSRGYNIVKRIPFLADAAEIVYSHHERFDGTGYPRGLKGKEIPLGARISAVADTVDAMTSNSRYRAKLPITAVSAEIKRLSGVQFDPEVVAVFLALPEHIWEDLRRQIDERPPVN